MSVQKYLWNVVVIGLVFVSPLIHAQEQEQAEEEETPRQTTEKSYAMLEQATARLQEGGSTVAQKDLATVQAELNKKEEQQKNLQQTVVRLQRDVHKLRERYANNPEAQKEIEEGYAMRIAASKEELAILGERIVGLRDRLAGQNAKAALDLVYSKDEKEEDTDWDKEYQALAIQRFISAKDLIPPETLSGGARVR